MTMLFVLWEILIPLLIAFLLGLLLGWLWWGWRRTKITFAEWETMRQKANRASTVEMERELAEVRAERDRLQAQVDSGEPELAAGDESGEDAAESADEPAAAE